MNFQELTQKMLEKSKTQNEKKKESVRGSVELENQTSVGSLFKRFEHLDS